MFKKNKKNQIAPSPDLLDQSQIVLWGPSGAGKDWLVNAFIKELESFNRQDRNFNYEILLSNPGDPTPVPLIPEPPITNATSGMEDYAYIFRRNALNNNSASQISAQSHNIIIHNNNGLNLVQSLTNQIDFDNIFQLLIHAQSIILILGIPVDEKITLSNIPDDSDHNNEEEQSDFNTIFGLDSQSEDKNGDDAFQSNWSQETYQRFIHLFFSSIGRSHRRNIAVCMTKSDQLNYRGDPWQILQRRFGDALFRLLELNRRYHNIEVFSTSATGYIRQNGIVSPNYGNGYLRDVNHWSPVNTTAPFFWIFEKIEIGRIQESPSFFRKDQLKSYIPYPRQRVY